MATYSSVKQAVADAAGVGGSVTTYSTPANLPTSGNEAGDQAFVSSNNRLYIWNGSGWYNIALINTSPSFSSSPDGTYELATDGSTTTITLVAADPEGLDITYTTTTDSNFDGLATVSNDSSVFTITPRSEDSATAESGNLTFKASDGVNLVSAISQFTLTFATAAIENSAYTAVLAKATGNAGTNTTFTDGSTNSHTITTVGDAHSTAFTPYHPGGYSAYFDGTGDSLQLTTSGDLQAIGRSGAAATIEAWVYLNSAPSSSGTAIYSQGTAGSTSGSNIISLEIQSNRTLRAMVNGGYSNTSGCPISTGTVPLQEWTHVALVLNSGTWTLYINGAADGTASGSYPSGTSHSTAYIGRIFYDAGRTGDMYVRDLRITSTAVYTTTFTPPDSTLTAVTNTKLLACHLPYIGDGSTSNYTITSNGDACTERFGPYDYAYNTANHGSSVYFDGSGDYLQISDAASLEFGSSNFTIEFWYYGNDTDQYATLATKGAITGGATGQYVIMMNHNNTGDIAVYFADHATNAPMMITTSDVGVSSNSWTHIAIVRNGTSWNLYVNGALEVSVTSSLTVANSAADVYIGRDPTYGRDLSGYIKDFRIVNGTAVYTSAFTPPTEPLTAITNTGMLLTASPSIYNAAGLSNSIKLYGNTQSSTAQTKNASSSIHVDGSGDYATVEDNTIFANTDVFTAECWVYPTASPSQPIIFGQWTSPQSWGILLSNDSNRYARLIFHDGGYRDTTTSTQLALNAWSHLALVKDGSTAKLYVNGALAGTRTGLGTLTGGDNTLSIGANASGQYAFQGYIEDARFTPGLARYTDTFTPPTSELEG